MGPSQVLAPLWRPVAFPLVVSLVSGADCPEITPDNVLDVYNLACAVENRLKDVKSRLKQYVSFGGPVDAGGGNELRMVPKKRARRAIGHLRRDQQVVRMVKAPSNVRRPLGPKLSP